MNKLLTEVSHWAGFCRYIVLGLVENATELHSSVEKKNGNLVLLLFLCIFAENLKVNKKWY